MKNLCVRLVFNRSFLQHPSLEVVINSFLLTNWHISAFLDPLVRVPALPYVRVNEPQAALSNSYTLPDKSSIGCPAMADSTLVTIALSDWIIPSSYGIRATMVTIRSYSGCSN